jgi:hypothetical protein
MTLGQHGIDAVEEEVLELEIARLYIQSLV